MGRPRREFTEFIDAKLEELLQVNTQARRDKKPLPYNENGILREINLALKTSPRFVKERKKSINMRSLMARLKKLLDANIADKERKGKNVFCYSKGGPAAFWEKSTLPFLRSMKISGGLTSFGVVPIGSTREPSRQAALPIAAVLLEDGIDVSTATLAEDFDLNFLQGLTAIIGDTLGKELERRWRTDEAISETKLFQLEEALQNAKLAIVFTIDGSRFGTARTHTLDEVRAHSKTETSSIKRVEPKA